MHVTLFRRRTRRVGGPRGFSILYVPLMFLLLFAFAALAIDIGRMRLGKSQLQAAADASARAGASGLPVSIPASIVRATNTANANTVLESNVSLLPGSDLEYGTWDPKTSTFTPIIDNTATPNDERDAANACHVTTRATSARGTAIPLWIIPHAISFDRNGGDAGFKPTHDFTTEAIAMYKLGVKKYGIVGLDWINFTGTGRVDSWSGIGPYPGTALSSWNADVASNGPITFSGTSDVYGDVHPGPGYTVSVDSLSQIHGSMVPLDAPVSYPPDSFPPGPYSYAGITDGTKKGPVQNGEFYPTSATSVVPGNYYFPGNNQGKAVTITQTGGIVTISGTTVFYADGDVDLTGGNLAGASPSTLLRITVTKAGTLVKLAGNTGLRIDLYAPLSTVKITGVAQFSGSVVGKTLTVEGTGDVHYDEAFGGYITPPKVILVK
jgi:hypothetical protein